MIQSSPCVNSLSLSSTRLFSRGDRHWLAKQHTKALAQMLKLIVSSTRSRTRSEPATLIEAGRWRHEERNRGASKETKVVKGNREDAARFVFCSCSQPELLVTRQWLEVGVDFLVCDFFQGCGVPFGITRAVNQH